MRRFLITAAVAIVLAVIIFQQYLANQHNKNSDTLTLSPSPSPTIMVKNIPVTVRLARTTEEITRGLGGTVSLPENEGMLFLFPTREHRIFWMKNMVMPIDIIWIADGKIVQIDAKVPPPDSPNVPDAALKRYPSNDPVDYVLEMNSGWSEKNDVVVGDIVELGNFE